jgi:hypothetical protein
MRLQIGNFAKAKLSVQSQRTFHAMPMSNKTFGRKQRAVEPPAAPPPARAVPDVDPRNTVRKRTLFKGILSYGQNCAFTVDCVIADISDAGARVQVQPGPPVPTDVFLVHLRERTAYEANVAWRRDNSLGLKFIARHDLENPSTEDLKVLRQHCVEHELR